MASMILLLLASDLFEIISGSGVVSISISTISSCSDDDILSVSSVSDMMLSSMGFVDAIDFITDSVSVIETSIFGTFGGGSIIESGVGDKGVSSMMVVVVVGDFVLLSGGSEVLSLRFLGGDSS